MRSQQDNAGGLRHLITLDGLTRDALTAILVVRRATGGCRGSRPMKGVNSRVSRSRIFFSSRVPVPAPPSISRAAASAHMS
jgi:hypothetical protein